MTDESTKQAPDTHFTRGVATEPTADELEFAPAWATKDELPRFSPISGLSMQSVTGGKMMANWVTIEPRQLVPRHQHPHEQLGIMLEGALELTLGDEARLLRPGDAYTIPPNLPHSARTYDEGCVVLDIFSPVREDYLKMAQESSTD
ncbi:MAG TPA: cupin domain-containing protein [Thermomicrobiales bacterium]|jgi:quercetin dioxygenase-like cupin family protein